MLGDGDGERAPPAGLAVERHVSSEHPGEFPDNGQAEAGPLMLPDQDVGRLAGDAGLAELLEDHLAVLGGDPDAVVDHGDDDRTPLGFRREDHPASFGGELDRVR